MKLQEYFFVCKEYLIWVSKMDKGPTGLEQHEGE